MATNGDNSNKGTIESPYGTIQRAVDVMSAGDVCYVREGIYRDDVLIESDNISIEAYQDEYVVLYGTEVVDGWQPYKDDIYRAKVEGIEPQFTQLIFNKKLQQMARYPDHSSGSMFSLAREGGYTPLETKLFGEIRFDAPLPGGKDHWKGGYFRAVSAKRGGTNPQGRIASSDGHYAKCDEINDIWLSSSNRETSHHLSNGPGDGYIFHLNALSIPGEWWCEDGYVYFWQPGGGAPAEGSVEVQNRDYVLSVNGAKGVALRGINVRLTGIEFNDCEDCVVEGCDFRDLKGWFYREAYGHSMREIGGVYLNGRNMSVKECYFTRSWGNLLNLDECDGVSIDNSVFEDNGWMGMFTSCILSNSDNVRVTNSTFGSTGRFHIRSDGHARLDILHCDFSDCMKMCQDAGSIELTNSGLLPSAMDMKGSEYAYNRFHDMYTLCDEPGTKQFVVALYFEGAENYTVHHNLFYNITNPAKDGSFVYLGPRQSTINDCYFYNNTVWNIDVRVHVWRFEKDGHVGDIENMIFCNNLFDDNYIDRNNLLESNYTHENLYDRITFDNNMDLPLIDAPKIFRDTRRDDFTLVAGSEPIDAGRVIPGITDGYRGAAPDLGCFESGVEPWSCGATLKVREFFPDEYNIFK